MPDTSISSESRQGYGDEPLHDAVAVMPAPEPDVFIRVRDSHGRLVRSVQLIRPGLTAGSLPSNGLRLEDATVARNHLRIDWDGERARVIDLGTRSGTKLGDMSLRPQASHRWKPGQPLHVGGFTLQL